MPTKSAKTTSKKKKIAVKNLPATKRKVTGKDMKKVKGGIVLCRSSQGGVILCKTNQSGVILCKTGVKL